MPLDEEEEKGCKVVVVGDGSVGKTCFLISFVENKFPAEYVPTIFDSYIYTLEDTQLNLIDTAGQEEFGELRPLSYEGAHIFIICFAVDNKTSLDNVDTIWYPEVNKYVKTSRTDKWLGNILVGTKSDLRVKKEDKRKPNPKEVPKEQAQAKADKYKMTYYETSALSGEGLREIFLDCIERYRVFQETGVAANGVDSSAPKRVSKRVQRVSIERSGDMTPVIKAGGKRKGKCVIC